MTHDQSKSPFAKLDTSLLRSTAQTQETGKQENLETRKHVFKETSKRAAFPKSTYQLDPVVTDMLEDAKRTLKRQYHLKVSLAEIVEEGVPVLYGDLTENKETSKLVSKFASMQENKET